jgi:hypothetical protein
MALPIIHQMRKQAEAQKTIPEETPSKKPATVA